MRRWERLRNARGFIFDMDGTLALGDRVNHGLRPLPGAIAMLDWARSRGLPYVVFTNGTNRTPAHFARVLRDAGLDVPDDRMMTPASSAVVMFAKRGFKRVHGARRVAGCIEPLREAGIEVVPPVEAAADARTAPSAWTPSSSAGSASSRWTTWRPRATRSGRARSSTARPRPRSSPRRAAGRWARRGPSRAMIRSITGCPLTITGKPSLDALRAAATRLGVPARHLVVVGDDPLLEVPMAHRGRRPRGRGRHRPRRARTPTTTCRHGERPHLHLRGRRRAARALPEGS